MSCVTEHNPYGGISTSDGTLDAFKRIDNYIEDANPSNKTFPKYTQDEITAMGITPYIEYHGRIFRTYNFFQATYNGLINEKGNVHLKDMLRWKKIYEQLCDTDAIVEYVNAWDWNVIRTELEKLWIEDNYWFQAILDDMEERIVEKDKTADDMMTFYNLCLDINRIQ